MDKANISTDEQEVAAERRAFISDFCRELDAEIRPALKDEEERLTFQVRPGVTYVDIEVFLKEKIQVISYDRAQEVIRKGTLAIFATGILERLRSSFKMTNNVATYGRKDLIREQINLLEGILTEALPEGELNQLLLQVEVDARRLLPNRKVGAPATAAYLKVCLDCLCAAVRGKVKNPAVKIAARPQRKAPVVMAETIEGGE